MSSTSPPVKDFEKIFEENDEYTTPPYVPSEEVTRPTNKTRTVLFSHPSHQDDGMEKLTKPNDSSDFSSRQMPHMNEPINYSSDFSSRQMPHMKEHNDSSDFSSRQMPHMKEPINYPISLHGKCPT